MKKCKECDLEICIKDCSHKCKRCKELICENCCKLCKICKNIFCGSCSIFCDECPNTYFAENQLVYCLNCEIDTIRQCQKKDCTKKLCLSCWNVCNQCDLILCSKDGHSLNCLNCEEKMCENHFHNCCKCNKNKDDINYKKLCLKNCTNKCSFCDNINNNLCSVENHKDNYVTNLNCGHNVCRQCLRGCAKCKNIVVSCPKCIVNYYFHKCKFCEFYLCNVCSRYCKNCEDNYCPFNKCVNCNKTSQDKCSNCINIEVGANSKALKKIGRNKCNQCCKSLESCEKCAKKFICCEACYNGYKTNLKLKTNDPKYKNKLDLNDICLNLYKNKNFEICEMFKCIECSSAKKNPNESDIIISPLSIRSEKDFKMSAINNNNKDKNPDNLIKENSKIYGITNINLEKLTNGARNGSIRNKPENPTKNVIKTHQHNNNHSVFNVNSNEDFNKNLNTSDNKKNIKKGIKDVKKAKKEKVTCLSMCLLF